MLDYLDNSHTWLEDEKRILHIYVSTATIGGFEELRKNKIYKHFKKL